LSRKIEVSANGVVITHVAERAVVGDTFFIGTTVAAHELFGIASFLGTTIQAIGAIATARLVIIDNNASCGVFIARLANHLATWDVVARDTDAAAALAKDTMDTVITVGVHLA